MQYPDNFYVMTSAADSSLAADFFSIEEIYSNQVQRYPPKPLKSHLIYY